MSGGGKSVSRGRMGSAVVSDVSVDPKELANMENELEKVSVEGRVSVQTSPWPTHDPNKLQNYVW